MHGEIGVWVGMLTGLVGDAASAEAIALEDSCRALQSQIAELSCSHNSHGRNPRDRLSELEASVAESSLIQTTLDEECTRLREEVRGRLEQRQSSTLARLEAARRRGMLSSAVEATERASSYFKMPFLTMSTAQIEKGRKEIDLLLRETRTKLGNSIKSAQTALQSHQSTLAETARYESEHEQLKQEIGIIERQLDEFHHVEPAVIRALNGLSAGQLEAYLGTVIQARLKDARHERARALRENVWHEASS